MTKDETDSGPEPIWSTRPKYKWTVYDENPRPAEEPNRELAGFFTALRVVKVVKYGLVLAVVLAAYCVT